MDFACNRAPAEAMSLVAPAIVLVAGTPLAGTVLLTSDLTPIGRATYASLYGHDKERWVVVALLILLAAYLLDVHLWKVHRRLAALVAGAAGLCFLVGVLFYAEVAPSIPIIVGMAATILSVVLLRQTTVGKSAADHFMWATAAVFVLYAALLTAVWLVWALTPHLGGYNYWSYRDELVALDQEHDILTRFLLWCSPLILAAISLLIALFALLRGRIHASGDAGGESDFIARELRLLLLTLALTAMVSWMAAAVAAADMGLSVAVLRISAAIGVSIIFYMTYALGLERIEKAAAQSNSVSLLLSFLQSDWSKGAFLTLALPLLPFYFGLEVLRQLVRGLHHHGKVDAQDGRWLTEEAQERWEALHRWNRGSVLVKSIWLGGAYFVCQVGISRGLTLFLAALSDQLASWNLASIFALLFLIGLVMFLLPPVPGTPIYLITGIVVVQRFRDDGQDFYVACSISVLFAFVLKLAAILMQQKAIGEPFASSVQVKKLVAINSPAMKAVKHILSQPGFSMGKVAVLVGGPDWPTSVLTGLYQLRAGEMLLGSIPIVFVIIPICFAGGFSVLAAEDKANAVQNQSIANVLIMLSSVILIGNTIIAGYFVEKVQAEFRAEIERGDWESDPQESEVLQAIEADEKESELLDEVTRWCRVPVWLKCLLYLGAALMSAMMYIVLLQVGQPFLPFSLNSHIADLPGGTIWGAVRPTGWACLALFGAAVKILSVFYVWRSHQASAWRSGELRPLYQS